MGFMSYKKRSKEEVEAILHDYKLRMPIAEICAKHTISGTAFNRLVKDSKGFQIEKRKPSSKVQHLEKIIAQRDLEIKLMKAALKKS